MDLLLDTHAYLWWLGDAAELAPSARERIADPRAAVFVSAASIWEASIKAALGRLDLGGSDLVSEIAANAFVELPVRAAHAARAGALAAHHQDPFDRMLVAQAELEALAIVSRDEALAAYGVPVLW